MQSWIASALVAASLLGLPAYAEPEPAPPRVVNVTAGSPPGWYPSEVLEQSARDTALAYLAAKDAGRAADAYGYLAPPNREDQPQAAFTEELGRFNTSAGPVKERSITTVTWSKDPANSPGPGIYAAIDLVSRFANIDRHCGYLVLWQPPTGGAFQVMREESNYMDNTAARAANAEEVWSVVSSNCPNYRPSPAGLADLPSGPLPETPDGGIGYASVAEALKDLRSRAGVVVTEENGWTIASEEEAHTVWSFSPPDYAAYPAAVKREAVQENGRVLLKMSVLCEASKAACDDLVRTFNQMNGALAEALGSRR